MFFRSKKEAPRARVDVGEVIATIHLHDGSTMVSSVHGFVFDGWCKMADRDLWLKWKIKSGLINLKNKSIPLTEVKEITFVTQSFFEET